MKQIIMVTQSAGVHIKDPDDCIGCNQCMPGGGEATSILASCPMGIIVESGSTPPFKFVNVQSCIECDACSDFMNAYCPASVKISY